MPGERLTGLLAQTLDGQGPALMPIPAGTPDTRVAELLAAMRPTSVLTPDGVATLDDGVPAREDRSEERRVGQECGCGSGRPLMVMMLLRARDTFGCLGDGCDF